MKKKNEKSTIKRGELLARPDLLKFREEAIKSGHTSTILGTPVITWRIRKLVGLSTSFTFRITLIFNVNYFKFSLFIFNKHFFHLLSNAVKVRLVDCSTTSIILFDFFKLSVFKGNYCCFEAKYFSA